MLPKLPRLSEPQEVIDIIGRFSNGFDGLEPVKALEAQSAIALSGQIFSPFAVSVAIESSKYYVEGLDTYRDKSIDPPFDWPKTDADWKRIRELADAEADTIERRLGA